MMKNLVKTILIGLIIFQANVGFCVTLGSLQKVIDWSCINFEIVGLCFKSSPPYVGVKVRYWEPVLLIETVKNPGDSVIDSFGAVVSSLAKKASQSLLGSIANIPYEPSSGGTVNTLSNSKLQFNEVHVYSFPYVATFSSLLSMSCSKTVKIPGEIKYLSELDSIEWRMGVFEALHPKSVLSASLGPVCSTLKGRSGGLCLGYWGPMYPRRGYFTHQSDVVGSAADAVRAVSIASLEGMFTHVVLSPLGFLPSPDKDKLQQIYPNPGGCFKIGSNPLFWESKKTSLNGKYLWIYWRHRDCCIF